MKVRDVLAHFCPSLEIKNESSSFTEKPRPKPSADKGYRFKDQAAIWILDDGGDLPRYLAMELKKLGCRPKLVSWSFIDFNETSGVDGLFILAGNEPGEDFFSKTLSLLQKLGDFTRPFSHAE